MSSPNRERMEVDDWPQESTLKILIATDNHVGFKESDGIRGKDSFDTFEEILQIANAQEVDMILLGGDLFHDNKPSRNANHRVTSLLRQYCMGDRSCDLKFLSDQTINFPDRFGTANYLDPNLNVSIPVFIIHGNHDDPSGLGGLSALQVLSAAGLVNYFGRSKGVDEIQIEPVLLSKGDTKLSLYGLGNIRDERLFKTYNANRVQTMRPTSHQDEWFNLMAVHQNRKPHNFKKTDYLPESYIEDFMDLVIWGHEHDCRIDPEYNNTKGFFVSQPGSSVATSLTKGESDQKHVGLLKVYGTSFHMEKIPLKTVRPFRFNSISLSYAQNVNFDDQKSLIEFLVEQVDKLIDDAKQEWLSLERPDNDEELEVPKPLIRLRVELLPGMDAINPSKLDHHFNNKVANPKEVIMFKKKQLANPMLEKTKRFSQRAQELLSQPLEVAASKVEDILSEMLEDYEPTILPNNHMAEAMKLFVDKEEKEAISQFVNIIEKRSQDFAFDQTQSDTLVELGEKVTMFMKEERLKFGRVEAGKGMSQDFLLNPIGADIVNNPSQTDDGVTEEKPKRRALTASRPKRVAPTRVIMSTTKHRATTNQSHIIENFDFSRSPSPNSYQDTESQMGDNYVPATPLRDESF